MGSGSLGKARPTIGSLETEERLYSVQYRRGDRGKRKEERQRKERGRKVGGSQAREQYGAFNNKTLKEMSEKQSRVPEENFKADPFLSL